MSDCPCRILDSEKKNFDECCGPIIKGQKSATTAESMMRSRYTAYVIKDIEYIDKTQMNEKHEVFNKEEALKWAESSEWQGLEIKQTRKGTAKDDPGVV